MAFDKLKKMLGDEDDREIVDEESFYTIDENKEKPNNKEVANQMILVEPRA